MSWTRTLGSDSFKAVAEEWLVKNEKEGRAPITLEKIRWLLEIAYPMIGSLLISKITAQEALAVLRKMEGNGRYESARRMRSVLSCVFRYGNATPRADRDVARDIDASEADIATLTQAGPPHIVEAHVSTHCHHRERCRRCATVIAGGQILDKQVDASHDRVTFSHCHTRDAFSHLLFVDRRGDSWFEVANL